MDSLKVITSLVFLSLVISNDGVEGIILDEQEMHKDRHIKVHDEQLIKSFKTKGGLYDCVAIYKQPAFDHPLLENHKIQMRPTQQPRALEDQAITNQNSVATSTEINCPQGTIPIRRTRKEDFPSEKRLLENFINNINPKSAAFPGQHVVATRIFSKSKAFYGIYGLINLQNPQVNLDQYSTAQMWIADGESDNPTSIQSGWMVAPQITGTNHTYLFIFWRTNNSRRVCFNHLCPGFIQVNSNISFDEPFRTISTYGGVQYNFTLEIFQDIITRNWWLQYDGSPVGYWPNSVIPQLSMGSSIVAWGGRVQGPHDKSSPPMGNGRFPRMDFKKACFISKLQIVNDMYHYILPKDLKTVHDSKCYGIKYYRNLKPPLKAILFGGPGGQCGV